MPERSGAWVGVLAVVAVGLFVAYFVITHEPVAAPVKPADAGAALGDRLAAISDLPQALALTAPLMKNTRGPQPDEGSEVFARWASESLWWSHMGSLEATTWALAMKDPALERGRRLCVTGQVAQIRADRAWNKPVYRGVLALDAASFVTFVAVGSTTNVLPNKEASFCGVVTGLWLYPSLSGEAIEAVHTVGMFEIKPVKR